MSRLKLVKVGDRAKALYSQKLKENISKCTSLTVQKTIKSMQTVEIGWTLKAKRKRNDFTKGQKEYMTEKFNICKISGCKIDPYITAEDMRLSGRFERVEFLTGQQIGSFFFLAKPERQKKWMMSLTCKQLRKEPLK